MASLKTEGNFIRKIYREKDLKRASSDLMMLGDQAKFDANTLITLRWLTAIVVFVVVIFISDNWGFILAPFSSIAAYYLFYYLIITIPLKQRVSKLDREALHFFEILTLTLESGRNLEKSLEVTVSNIDSEISKEFEKTLFEMKFGKSLIEALEDMKLRIPSETINNIILNITQTSVFGNSIVDTLYNQVDFLRDKQILEIKGQINKIPNKISIISVIFIVPLILMLILGPFLINFIGNGV